MDIDSPFVKTYEWRDISKDHAILYMIHTLKSDGRSIKHGIAEVYKTHKDGSTKWRAAGGYLASTYHARKKQAQEQASHLYMAGKSMNRIMNNKILDLTNAYWETDSIGETRYDILRVKSRGELHQLATVYESRGYIWAAIRGKGHRILEGCNTLEEARAVVIALIRMEG